MKTKSQRNVRPNLPALLKTAEWTKIRANNTEYILIKINFRYEIKEKLCHKNIQCQVHTYPDLTLLPATTEHMTKTVHIVINKSPQTGENFH